MSGRIASHAGDMKQKQVMSMINQVEHMITMNKIQP